MSSEPAWGRIITGAIQTALRAKIQEIEQQARDDLKATLLVIPPELRKIVLREAIGGDFDRRLYRTADCSVNGYNSKESQPVYGCACKVCHHLRVYG